VTKDLLENRYRGADVIFLAGSVMRGEASTYSDIDIVVIFPKLESAYRESFFHLEWPVEAFVHDPETLRYFLERIDRQAASATLADMVFEGIETPAPTELSTQLKAMAESYLQRGPLEWTKAEIEDLRYQISELIDDIREPRSRPELMAAGSAIYPILAEFFLRSKGQFVSRGKAILKRLKRVDPGFSRRFADAFELLFQSGRGEKIIELAEELLAPHGGLLFDGYKRQTNPEWRLKG